MNLPQLKRIRAAVRAVLALGVAASIAGNVLHAHGGVISQVISAWSPLALLLTIELISRVPVHSKRLARVRWAAAALIAGIAAWVSYWHMAAVASRYGETGGAQYLLPLSVDGLVVVASVSLVELGGRISAATAEAPEPVAVASAVVPVKVWDYAEPIGPMPAPEPFPDAKPRASRPRAKTLTSAAKVRRAAAKLPGGTVAEIAAKAGVSESTARRYLPAPGDATVASASGPDAAETATNGHAVDLVEVTA
ncbi:DUF2637 domain-containing protein [Micromonospora chalcea]|uniref:DUF2637 domain-containing protein n=1 Tax=Micromonospora chalcea TaxID=1874 RepID=UPI003810158B